MKKKLFKSFFSILVCCFILIAFSFNALAEYSLNDPYYAEQKNLSIVSAPFAWEKGVFGEGVKIAVIDSGLYNSASDFDFKRINKVKDYTETASKPNTFCHDETGHGSIATGIIASKHNNNLGIAGIAPKAEIYIFKCAYIDEELGYEVAPVSNIIDAIRIAIDTYDCDIINVSLGITQDYKPLKAVVDYAEEKGVLFVAAAGNDGSLSSNVYYPASYDSVISVGSVREDGKHRYSGSQRNNFVNIMAPGEKVLSVTNGGYAKGTGTSFAAPHVAAAAALAKSLNPSLSAKQLREALYATATPMRDSYSGHGLLNIHALLTYVKSTLSEGRIITSTYGTNTCSYFTAPKGYVVYKPSYNSDGILTSVKSSVTVSITDNLSDLFIWNKNNLSPYSIAVTEEIY